MTSSVRIPVPVATPQVVAVVIMPVGIDVSPGAGGSIKVECTRHPGDAATWGQAVWFPWAKGTVAIPAEDTLLSPCTYLKFTALTSDGVAHVCQ